MIYKMIYVFKDIFFKNTLYKLLKVINRNFNRKN